jgi:hypothetical protein
MSYAGHALVVAVDILRRRNLEAVAGFREEEVEAIAAEMLKAAYEADEDCAGRECERLESDLLEIHDALEAGGCDGVINADSIIERIEALVKAKPKCSCPVGFGAVADPACPVHPGARHTITGPDEVLR